MTPNTLIYLILLFLFLDLLLASVRISLVNAHLPRLLNIREEREEAVDSTIQRIERPRVRYSLRLAHLILLTLLIGSVIWWGLLSGWMNTLHEWGVAMIGLACIISAILIYILESTIEGWVLKNPEEWAIRTGFIGSTTDFILGPFSSLAIRIMGQSENSLQKITAPTDDELKTWVKQGQKDGALEKEEREMIYSIFQYGDTLAREIMVPRMDMLALDVETSVESALDAFIDLGHSRVPVYESTIDNIIGLLYAKDLLKHSKSNQGRVTIRETLRPAYFVPEAKKLDDLLTEMQTRRVHMAIVVDEYGGVAGLVTLENILEEIIGEIQDEYDQSEELPFERISETEFIFQGSIDLDDFNEVMHTDFTKDIADTLGGYVYGAIGKVPTGGESVQVNDIELIVEQVIGRRIHKVRARIQPDETQEETQNVDSNPT